MEIYPSRRTCDAPSIVKENTEKNASFAKMSSEGWYLAEAYLPGVPFPAPKTGAEVMTNGKYRYQGVGVEFPKTFTTVSPRKGTSEFIKVDAYMVSYTPWGVKSANQLSKLPPVEFYANFGYNAPWQAGVNYAKFWKGKAVFDQPYADRDFLGAYVSRNF